MTEGFNQFNAALNVCEAQVRSYLSAYDQRYLGPGWYATPDGMVAISPAEGSGGRLTFRNFSAGDPRDALEALLRLPDRSQVPLAPAIIQSWDRLISACREVWGRIEGVDDFDDPNNPEPMPPTEAPQTIELQASCAGHIHFGGFVFHSVPADRWDEADRLTSQRSVLAKPVELVDGGRMIVTLDGLCAEIAASALQLEYGHAQGPLLR